MRKVVIYYVCDGCKRNTQDDKISIEVTKHFWRGSELHTIDVCKDCWASGVYICDKCHGAHSDNDACKAR